MLSQNTIRNLSMAMTQGFFCQNKISNSTSPSHRRKEILQRNGEKKTNSFESLFLNFSLFFLRDTHPRPFFLFSNFLVRLSTKDTANSPAQDLHLPAVAVCLCHGQGLFPSIHHSLPARLISQCQLQKKTPKKPLA